MSENLPMASKTGWGDLDPNIVREDVTAIVKEVLSDREVMRVFWGSAIEAFQERATVGTGRLALGALSGVLRKGLLWAALGLGIYYLGGMGALIAFVKTHLSGH